MPVNILWENDEHTIIRMNFVGHWSWDEAYVGSERGYQMVDSVTHVVDTVIDMSQSAELPLLALTHARNMLTKRHPRSGTTIFIGTNLLFLRLWKAFASAYSQSADRQAFAFARTIEEANEIISNHPHEPTSPR